MTNQKIQSMIVLIALIGNFIFQGLLARDALAATFTFKKIVDSFDPIPGEPGMTFFIPGGSAGTPAVDGGNVVFVTQGELWTVNSNGGFLTKLADSNTPIPNGTGNFGDVFPFRINNGTVVFRGNGIGQAGYYAIPAGGGALTTLANQDTAIPGGTGTFGPLIGSTGGSNNGFNLDNGNLVFQREVGGVYAVPVAGGPVTVVGDGSVFICEVGYGFGGIGTYRTPDISGQTVAMLVTNVFGQGAIYTTPLSGLTGVADPCASPALKATNATRVASVNTPVPEDPQGRNFDAFAFSAPLIDEDTVVFSGAAFVPVSNYDLAGLYSFSPTNGLRKLVDTNTPVPEGTGNFIAGGVFTGSIVSDYSLSKGMVVFRGTDATGKQGLYLVPANGGSITKIIAIGDPLGDGRTLAGINGLFFQPPIQADSLSGSQLAIRVDFSDPTLGTGVAIYVTNLISGSLLPVPIAGAADYNGDGTADISVYTPSTGQWFVQGTAIFGFPFGSSSDVPTPGDYDGDGITDLAFFRAFTGEWHVLLPTGEDIQIWGQFGDVPIPGDYDGDKKTDRAIWRRSTGDWFALLSTGGVKFTNWGISEDTPAPADYDGDGIDDFAVFRPSTGQWFLLNSSTGIQIVTLGKSGDFPVPADYDGDKKANIAVWSSDTGTWKGILKNGKTASKVWGATGDLPIPADFDGDGRADLGIFNTSLGFGQWFILTSSTRYNSAFPLISFWGLAGDFPVTASGGK
jgi:hypothetical protein